MNLVGVWGVLSLTFREAIRTKWLLIFALIFFLLSADVLVLFLSAANAIAPGFLQTNLRSQLSIIFTLVPLLALPIGALSIVEDRESGTLQYLLSNPITKSEFFLGRGAGLLLATTTVIFIGFGTAALVVYNSDTSQYDYIVVTMLIASLLNAVMLALALIISEVSRRKATALGISLLFWFLLTFISDVGTLTNVIHYSLFNNHGLLVAMLMTLLDPVETSRLATIAATNQIQQFGPTGTLASHVLGNNLFAVTLGSTVVWLAFLAVLGFAVFKHQDA